MSAFSSSLLTPRTDLQPLLWTVPLTPSAALAPPLCYYLALLLLPPSPRSSSRLSTLVPIIRSFLAIISGILFFRLPLAYHVPFSIGLTYQLALVGLYGGSRVLDAFFLSPYLFGHVPRRVRYHHAVRTETPGSEPEGSSYFNLHFLSPKGQAITEIATTDQGWPHGWWDRAAWALELELSMRGAGFTWSSADVRHTRKTWTPSVGNMVHSIAVHVLPILSLSWGLIRNIYVGYLDRPAPNAIGPSFDDLPFGLQLLLTAALGGFLMSAFSFGHSMFAILMSPISPSPLAYFPPLYTNRVWSLTSVRGFWSYGWHRLFSRLFLVYGVWPGEWIERKLTGKRSDMSADVGKVLGGFLSSAFVHSFASWTVHKGCIDDATGEAKFFTGCGIAVILEELVKRFVMNYRRGRTANGNKVKGHGLERWYDGVVGRIWWSSVLLYMGRNFARGWYVPFHSVSSSFEEDLENIYPFGVQPTPGACLSITSPVPFG